jgi:hypothetical protein
MALSEKGKKILVWSTVVAILGVGGYFGYKALKKKREEKNAKEEEERLRLLALQNTSNESGGQGSGQGSGQGGGQGVGQQLQSPFKNETEIKAFQDWLDKTHPFWIKDTDGKYKNLRVGTTAEPNRHVGGKGYGKYGQNTASAYALFGKEYGTKASGSSIPSNLKTLLSRLGSRAVYKNIDGNLYGVEVVWEHGSRKLPFRFFDNNRFFVLNEDYYPIFKGSFADGGRQLVVTEDNYSKTSKVGTTFKTDSFWTTGQKLFTDKKA